MILLLYIPDMSAGHLISPRIKDHAPLALTTTKVILDIVDCVPGCRATLAVTGTVELGAEGLVVLVLANLIDDNLLLVIGDLEDNELGLAMAHAEVIECSDALILDGNTANRRSIREGSEGGSGVSYPDASCTTAN